MTRWGLPGKGKPMAFIFPPSADGVQDSREWPELAPICSYLALIGGQFPGQGENKRPSGAPGYALWQVGAWTCQRRRALFLLETQGQYASGFGSRALEVCQVARELAAGPGAPGAGAQREGRELAPGNSPPNQEASEARLLGLRRETVNPVGGLWREEPVTGHLVLLFGFRAKILSLQSPQALLSPPPLPLRFDPRWRPRGLPR